jgi:hypothetical protein
MNRTKFSRLYGSVYLRLERSDGRLGKICSMIIERRGGAVLIGKGCLDICLQLG